MRREFHRQLEFLRADLGNMCKLSGVAARRATTALLEVDAESAGQVLTEVERLRLLNNAVERRAVIILARQAPVAGDLRATVTAIQIAADADRMGGLAAHVAKLCLRRHPRPVVPDELHAPFARMGEIAVDLADRCRAAVLAADCAQAHRVRDDDRAMDALHWRLFTTVMSPQWPYGPSVAIDIVLLGRFYGRFADHAAEIARRVIFQTTGSYASDLIAPQR
jgi:phosphate transport system protein